MFPKEPKEKISKCLFCLQNLIITVVFVRSQSTTGLYVNVLNVKSCYAENGSQI